MLMLGRALSEDGSIDSAIEVLDRLLAREPDHFVGRFNLATAYAQAEQYAEAAEHFRRALSLAPGNHDARLAAAKCEVNLGNAQQALDLIIGWQEEMPPGIDRFEVDYLRGIAHRHAGSLEQSRDALLRAVALQPRHAGARRELGTVLARQGQLAEAIRQLQNARELEPESEETWLELFAALQAIGDDQALAAETALFEQRRERARQEQLAERLAMRASRSLEQGDARSALREYRQALASWPGNAEYHYGAALAHARLGDTQARITALQNALQLSPEMPEALNDLGVAYTEASRFREAEVVLRAAVQSGPQLASASNNLGVLLAKQGRHADAEAMFRRAIEDDPGYVHAHVNLAVALASMGRLGDAAAAIHVAAGIEPTSQLVGQAKGMIDQALRAR